VVAHGWLAASVKLALSRRPVLLSRIETVLRSWFATAKSGLPSRLKSPYGLGCRVAAYGRAAAAMNVGVGPTPSLGDQHLEGLVPCRGAHGDADRIVRRSTGRNHQPAAGAV